MSKGQGEGTGLAHLIDREWILDVNAQAPVEHLPMLHLEILLLFCRGCGDHHQ